MRKLTWVAVVLGLMSTGVVRAANPIVAVETSMGNFKIELFDDKAPVTVKNFLAYIDEQFYDGTVFHRVMGKENYGKDFMIQGGGYVPDSKEKTGMAKKPTKEPIINEATNGLGNQVGTVAMARVPTDANSATSQFFINVADNKFLDKKLDSTGIGYCVFGKVTEGMDVVNKIKAVKTAARPPLSNVPVEDVVIKSMKREQPK
jgi:cyclophilin family peptidyl-prolyl cis-trans isomerase